MRAHPPADTRPPLRRAEPATTTASLLAGAVAVALGLVPLAVAASECVKWEKSCDSDGNCIDVCVEYGDAVPPFEVKKSGETAAPGTVSPSHQDELEDQKKQEELKKSLPSQ